MSKEASITKEYITSQHITKMLLCCEVILSFVIFAVLDVCWRMLSLYKSSAVAEMSDRGHNRHGPKRGGGRLCPFRGGELGPHLTQCRLGRGMPCSSA